MRVQRQIELPDAQEKLVRVVEIQAEREDEPQACDHGFPIGAINAKFFVGKDFLVWMRIENRRQIELEADLVVCCGKSAAQRLEGELEVAKSAGDLFERSTKTRCLRWISRAVEVVENRFCKPRIEDFLETSEPSRRRVVDQRKGKGLGELTGISERPVEQPVGQPVGQLVGQLVGQPVEQPVEQPAEIDQRLQAFGDASLLRLGDRDVDVGRFVRFWIQTRLFARFPVDHGVVSVPVDETISGTVLRSGLGLWRPRLRVILVGKEELFYVS